MKSFNSEKISSEEMAILDNNSEWLGIPKSHLMECAGYSFAKKIITRGYLGTKGKALIFCGTGNNGGDGFVVARHLSSYGVKVLVILVGDPARIRTKEAKLNWEIIYNKLTYSIEIEIVKDSTDLINIANRIKRNKDYPVVVDGLLGTGIEGKIREPIASAIDLINDIKKADNEKITVVSIDVPSGLNPNTGDVVDKAVIADLVITFHKRKLGLSCSSIYIKEILDRSIGIPPEANLFVGRGDLIPTLKIRKVDNYKGQFGRILVVGGSKNYSGAPAYSSLTAINFGIDLVITYVPEVVGDVLRSYSPNMIVRTNPGNWLNMDSFSEISELIEWSNAVIIGPGLGQKKETKDLLIALLENMNPGGKNYVLDADALKLVKNNLDLLKNKNVILTPHEGEFKIMTGIELPSNDKIVERSNVLLKIAQDLDVTLLVKGVYDYISNKENLKINRTGCPEMSVGGTGDVLAGLCGCFLATKNNPFSSACSAAFLNGIIGEYCKLNIGDRFTALDMTKNINNALQNINNF
jgi:NAD(P)H-hydrate epimerase